MEIKTKDWMNLISSGEILPFFQPILSLEDKSIFGYEALGRLRTKEGKILSLGPFFENGWQDLESKLSIDRELRKKALIYFSKKSPFHKKLFLNISPRLMKRYLDSNGSQVPTTIQFIEELEIPPDRIVIEIIEEHLDVNIETLKPLVELYKKKGFLVAIDDVGSKSSNLDRIGSFHPDIIKVDMQMLHRSMFDRNFSEILYNLSHLAQSLGISLLFEGIEQQDEFNKAFSYGARYVQGFLFTEPSIELAEESKFQAKLEQFLSSFFERKNSEILQKIEWEKRIEKLLDGLSLEKNLSPEGFISNYQDVFKIDPSIRRFYITDLKGNQISPNFVRKSENFIFTDYSARFKNWSWRPYFLNHLYNSIKSPNSWIISQPYHDLSENSLLRTFSKTLDSEKIIFFDIVYEEIFS